MFKIFLFFLLAISFMLLLNNASQNNMSATATNKGLSDSTKHKGNKMPDKIIKTDELWKKELTPEQYRILREKGTERAFTGKYWNNFEYGTYVCAGCGTSLFDSDTKFESGCGWPSYFDPIDSGRIIYREDTSYGMIRTEVLCAKCGGHLGHVFDDGPPPTGLRYCINSGSMKFIQKDK